MTISRRQFVQLATGAAAWPVFTAPARAQAYPARPVRVVVPVAPGGANDTTARLVAQKLSDHLGQQFYCENQVGAGGNIAFAATAKAPKDGYTLLAPAVTSSSIRRSMRGCPTIRSPISRR